MFLGSTLLTRTCRALHNLIVACFFNFISHQFSPHSLHSSSTGLYIVLQVSQVNHTSRIFTFACPSPLLAQMIKTACNAGDPGSIPRLRRFPWRRKWLPTPEFLPREFHGQRSLAGCSPWGSQRVGYHWAINTFSLESSFPSFPGFSWLFSS